MLSNTVTELKGLCSYQDMQNAEKNMRVEIFKIMMNNPQYQRVIADDIGVSRICISRFLREEEVSFVNLCKIRNYLLEKFDKK